MFPCPQLILKTGLPVYMFACHSERRRTLLKFSYITLFNVTDIIIPNYVHICYCHCKLFLNFPVGIICFDDIYLQNYKIEEKYICHNITSNKFRDQCKHHILLDDADT